MVGDAALAFPEQGERTSTVVDQQLGDALLSLRPSDPQVIGLVTRLRRGR